MTDLTATPSRVMITSAAIGAGWGALLFWGFSLPWPLGAGAGSAVAHFVAMAMLMPSSPGSKVRSAPNRQYANEIDKIPAPVQFFDENHGYPRAQIDELPIPREKVRKVAKLLQSGRTFSGALAGRYKPLSRSEWEALRDWLIDGGHAHWRDQESHSQGVELGRGGAAFFRYYAGEKVIIDMPTPSRGLPHKLMFASR